MRFGCWKSAARDLPRGLVWPYLATSNQPIGLGDLILMTGFLNGRDMSGSILRICRKFALGTRLLTVLVCLSIASWSASPTVAHTPKLLESVQDQLQMIEDHGHSHGEEIDILWAMHGHQHDVADHDHHSVDLTRLAGGPAAHFGRDDWMITPSDGVPARIYLLERPPRV